MEHDLVVFVPGILGSRLTRGGEDVWHRSSQRIMFHSVKELAKRPLKPAAAFEELMLPPGIGDNRPEPRWAVSADEPVKGADALPGLLATLGQPDIRGMLGGLTDGQYVSFTYDWRLSNRVTAAELKKRVGRELARWREYVKQHLPHVEDEPKVMFLCHSMGGLITRYYLECLGGAETARALVTIGTPHRGAAKAVRFLTGNGVGPGDDQPWLVRAGAVAAGAYLNSALMEVSRTFPSVAQLLPVYQAVVEPGRTRRRYLDDEGVSVADLPSELIKDAFAFHTEFEEACERNRLRGGGPWPSYRVHSIGGRAHPTVHGVQIEPGGRLKFPNQLDDTWDWTGDGTVPEESAFPGWALRDMSEGVWNGYRHAALPGGGSVGHQLVTILRGRTARNTLAGDEEFGITAPELAVAGEPFDVVVQGADDSRSVRAGLRQDGKAAIEPVILRPDGDGLLRGELTAAAGTWVLQVEADGPQVVHRDVVTVVEP
ncbi:lipase family alpha/beta hydrolase [Streptomyces mirabilis]|uniref:lipase family alpha/beta hydrolase n=1 Tax=Streptomyces mirabilis TaxID=68239 RepID=UPI00369E07F3